MRERLFLVLFFLEGVNLPYAQTFQGMPSHFGLFVLNVRAIYHLNGLLCSLLSYIYLLTQLSFNAAPNNVIKFSARTLFPGLGFLEFLSLF